MQASLFLSPVGEFSFVIASAGAGGGRASPAGHKLAIAVIAMSLLVSPIWFLLARLMHRLVLGHAQVLGFDLAGLQAVAALSGATGPDYPVWLQPGRVLVNDHFGAGKGGAESPSTASLTSCARPARISGSSSICTWMKVESPACAGLEFMQRSAPRHGARTMAMICARSSSGNSWSISWSKLWRNTRQALTTSTSRHQQGDDGIGQQPAQLGRQHDRQHHADIGGQIAEIMGLVGGRPPPSRSAPPRCAHTGSGTMAAGDGDAHHDQRLQRYVRSAAGASMPLHRLDHQEQRRGGDEGALRQARQRLGLAMAEAMLGIGGRQRLMDGEHIERGGEKIERGIRQAGQHRHRIARRNRQTP